MSDERYQPRLCERSCDSFNDDSGLCLHDDPDAGPYVVPGQICVVWLRQAAEALAAMEAMQSGSIVSVVRTEVYDEVGTHREVHVRTSGGLDVWDRDATQAVLAAAKAEKGGV